MSRSFVFANSDRLDTSVIVLDPDSGPGTVGLWFRFAGATGFVRQIMVQQLNGGGLGRDFLKVHQLSVVDFRLESFLGGAATQGGTNLLPDRWYHGAAVWPRGTAGRMEVYLDGVSDGNRFVDPEPCTSGTWRFAAGKFGGDRFEGRLAECGVWNVALTAAELRSLAAGYGPLFVRPENLLFYLPLVRDDDNDLVGGLSLTASGSPGIAEHPRVINPGRGVAGLRASEVPSAMPMASWACRRRRRRGAGCECVVP